jgi:acrylyl-CoA reductase (NADPH)
LAGGAALPTTVIPFILRGINLLGIDSVFYPNERRCAAWEHLGCAIPTSAIDAITRHVDLADVVPLGKEILAGHVRGRIVVDIEP